MRISRVMMTAASAALLLSACGGTELTQEQTAEALLTDEDFPVDGFTRGEVEDYTGNSAEEDMDASEFLSEFDVSQECIDAFNAVRDVVPDEVEAGSKAEYTGGGEEALMPQEVQINVYVAEDTKVGEVLADIADTCESVTMSEEGFELAVDFEPIEGAEGSKMSMDVMGETMEMHMSGAEVGSTAVVVMGTGLEDADIASIVDAQVEKVEDVG